LRCKNPNSIEKDEDLVETQQGHLHDGKDNSTLEHYHTHWHNGLGHAALIGITVISLKFYQRFQYRMIHYSKYLPKIAALFLIFMSIGIVIGVI
jgi:hypothetical protein